MVTAVLETAFDDSLDPSFIGFDILSALNREVLVDDDAWNASDASADGIVVFGGDHVAQRVMLFGEQLNELFLVDVALVGDLRELAAATDVAILHEIGVEQGVVVALLGFVTEVGAGFPSHLCRERTRWWGCTRCPGGRELGIWFQVGRPLPRLGVPTEFLKRGGFRFGAQQETLPLDIDRVAHAAFQFIDTHGAYMTPRSKKVTEHFEYNWCGHEESPMLSPSQAAAIPTTTVSPT